MVAGVGVSPLPPNLHACYGVDMQNVDSGLEPKYIDITVVVLSAQRRF